MLRRFLGLWCLLLAVPGFAKTLTFVNQSTAPVYVASSEYREYCGLLRADGACAEVRKGYYDVGWTAVPAGHQLVYTHNSNICLAVNQSGRDLIAAWRASGRDFGAAEINELAVHPRAAFQLFWVVESENVRVLDLRINGQPYSVGGGGSMSISDATDALDRMGMVYYQALCSGDAAAVVRL